MTSVLVMFLGVGWGAIAASPLLRRTAHALPCTRARALAPTRPTLTTRGERTRRVATRAIAALGPFVRAPRSLFVARRSRVERDRLEAELPVAVDLLAVAVGAGCTPYAAVEVAARWAPVRVAEHLHGVRRACALGSSFSDALGAVAIVQPVLGSLAGALTVSDRTGAPVGEQLARLANEQRATARRAAETRARAVPVRLLFPLVFLVLPAFGLLTVVPVLLAGLSNA